MPRPTSFFEIIDLTENDPNWRRQRSVLWSNYIQAINASDDEDAQYAKGVIEGMHIARGIIGHIISEVTSA